MAGSSDCFAVFNAVNKSAVVDWLPSNYGLSMPRA